MVTMRIQAEPAAAGFSAVASTGDSAAGVAVGALPGKDPLTAAVAAALSAMGAIDGKNIPITVSEQTQAGLMGSQNVASYESTDQSNAAKLADPSVAV